MTSFLRNSCQLILRGLGDFLSAEPLFAGGTPLGTPTSDVIARPAEPAFIVFDLLPVTCRRT